VWRQRKFVKNKIDWECGTYGERRGAYRIFVGKPDGKRKLRRPGSKWKDNIKCIVRKWDVGAWTGLI
jgi:hypothetical protein